MNRLITERIGKGSPSLLTMRYKLLGYYCGLSGWRSTGGVVATRKIHLRQISADRNQTLYKANVSQRKSTWKLCLRSLAWRPHTAATRLFVCQCVNNVRSDLSADLCVPWRVPSKTECPKSKNRIFSSVVLKAVLFFRALFSLQYGQQQSAYIYIWGH